MPERPIKGKAPELVVNELYPNAYASGTVYPDPGDGPHGEKTEHGIKCAQCGYPIPDRRRAKECPSCSSDNFEGQSLAK